MSPRRLFIIVSTGQLGLKWFYYFIMVYLLRYTIVIRPAGSPASTNANSSQMCGFAVDFAHKIGCHSNSHLRDRKTNFSSFIYSHSSTNTANLVTISPVDVQIIGLREIVKKEAATEHIAQLRLKAEWAKLESPHSRSHRPPLKNWQQSGMLRSYTVA